jgi:hypothetical protein
MGYRFWRAAPLVIIGLLMVGCGTVPAAGPVSGAACTSPIASKSWYMQDSLMGYQDGQQKLGIMFTAYNLSQTPPDQKEDAYFDVPGGNYSFPPDVRQTSPGVFSLSFSGAGQFTGAHSGRAATVDLRGSADENTGAVDLTLKADGSAFHLAIPPADASGAVALSRRIAADIQSKNWSDVYDAYTPTLKQAGYSKADLARDMNAGYRHVSSACRLGPGRYTRDEAPFPFLGDRFTDVIAITVTRQSGPPIATFATIDLKPANGTWVLVGSNPPGVAGGGTEPTLFGIPAPSP